MTLVQCHVCHDNKAKYKCPACATQTCSVACTKAHQAAAKCSGKRNQTAFIPRSKFSETSVNNDYNFLTRLERDLDNAAKVHEEVPAGRNFNQVKGFVKRAKDVGEVTVQLAPRGMKRARTNKSAWVQKRGQLSWTVEWLFDGAVSKLSDRVLDSTILKDAVAHHLRKIEAELETFKQNDVGKLHFLIKNEELGTKEPIYSVLDIEKTLGEALRHRSIIEYPTIHVYTAFPTNLKLERQYAYVQPSIESLATSLVKGSVANDTSTNTNDFIALGMDEDDSADSDQGAASLQPVITKPASDTATSRSLPVIDFDDLEVPYT